MRKLTHRDDRINKHHQIGPRTHLFDRIRRTTCSQIEVSTKRRSQMPARRKSDDPDLARIDVPLLRIRPNISNGARSIEQLVWLVVRHSQSVLENKCGDAE